MHKILPPSNENLKLAAEALHQKGLIAYPTETLYGLGANAYDDDAVKAIYASKGRDFNKAISVNYLSFDDVEKDFFITDDAIKISESFLPGPLTIILKKKPESRLSKYLSKNNKVGIRISSHFILRKLMLLISFPITSTSANLHNCLTKNAQEVSENLKDTENLIILDGGEVDPQNSSTVLDLTEKPYKILRIGAIAEKEILQLWGKPPRA